MTTVAKDQRQAARCKKCVMPDCTPGSDFDESGACRWCRTGFPPCAPAGEDALRELLAKNLASGGAADCMVGVSGGKDGCYALLQLKQKYHVRLEAFTYVHDGFSEASLENAKKTCRTLDVPHHTVSLPNHLHLRTFRRFFQAWIHSEDPISAAMTCVACKQMHNLGARLARDRGIPMMIWATSPFETPPFIPTQSARHMTAETVGTKSMTALGMDLMWSMCKSRRMCTSVLRHLPTCIVGCLAFRPAGKFLSLRYPTVKHIRFFDYCDWNADEIVQTLATEVGWRSPRDGGDWHSDCLFHVLKEYTFQKMYGVSYIDAFLSNQIRHGLITRKRALRDLAESKRFCAQHLENVLGELGWRDLAGLLDPTCFDAAL